MLRVSVSGTSRGSWGLLGVVAASLVASVSASDATPTAGWDVGPRVWLIDLPRTNEVWGFLQKEMLGGARTSNRSVSLGLSGLDSPHGVAMFPEGGADYALDGTYRTLRGAAFLATVQAPPPGGFLFRISGDGKTLWESVPLFGNDTSQPFLVDVTGVRVLRLEVLFGPGPRPPKGQLTKSGWHEPFLSTAAASPEDLAMFAAERWQAQRAVRELIAKAAKAFAENDFATVEQVAERLETDGSFRRMVPHPRNDLIDALLPSMRESEQQMQAHLERLSRYTEKCPTSATPKLAAARTHLIHAFQARGEGPAAGVPEQAWQAFHDRIDASADVVARPASEEKDYSLRHASLLTAAACQGKPIEDAESLLDQALQVDPREATLFTIVGHWWDPRWGGEPGAIAKVERRLHAKLPDDEAGLASFFLAAPQWGYYKTQIYEASQLRPEDVAAGARLMLRDHSENRHYVNLAAALACISGDRDLAREAFKIVDGAYWAPDVWGTYQYLATCRETLLGPEPGDADSPFTIALPAQSWCNQILFTADSTSLVTLENFAIRSWDVERRQPAADASLPKATGAFAAVPEKSDEFIVKTLYPLDGAFVHRIALGGKFPAESFRGPKTTPHSIDIASDRKHLYAMGDRRMWTWSLDHPEESRSDEVPGDMVAAFVEGGDHVLVRTQAGLQLWDRQAREAVGAVLKAPPTEGGPVVVHQARRLNDGRQVLVVTADRVGTFDVQDGSFTERFRFERGAGAAFSADERRLAIAFANGEIEIRDMQSGKVVQELRGHRRIVRSLKFSPDGIWLASLGFDDCVKVWPLGEPAPKR